MRGCKGVKVVAPLASGDTLRLVVNGDMIITIGRKTMSTVVVVVSVLILV